MRTRLQAAAARGLTRFVGRDANWRPLRRAVRARRTGQGQVVAVSASRESASRAWCMSSPTRTAAEGWRILESSVPLVWQSHRVFAGDPPAQSLWSRSTTAMTPQRAGKGDRQGADPERGLADVGARTARGARGPTGETAPWQPRPAAAAPANPGGAQAPAAAGEQEQPLISSSRICTGLTARRRSCSTAWWRASPPPRLLLLVNYRPEYPARLGRRDVLHAGAPRSRCRRRRQDPAQTVLGDDAELRRSRSA